MGYFVRYGAPHLHLQSTILASIHVVITLDILLDMEHFTYRQQKPTSLAVGSGYGTHHFHVRSILARIVMTLDLLFHMV